MHNLDMAIVDLETTGGNAMQHRIIEVAVLRVKGGNLVDSFSTLIDPERKIPPFIEHLTGITSEALRGAPTFREVKDRLFDLVNGPIFVAHNARFDYGFLKEEFEREDMEFSARCLCTVRLSKLLFPEQKRHNLDSIIHRLGIACQDRHRALGDAKALLDFLNIIRERFGEDEMKRALGTILKAPALPSLFDEAVLASLPESPGVYIFYDQDGKPLYVGKSVNVRSRVLSHFSEHHASAKDVALAKEVADVEVVKTVGELGALLMEAHLIKKLRPSYNARSRLRKRLLAVRKLRDDAGYGTIRIEQLDGMAIPCLPEIVALFSSRKAARQFLWNTVKEHNLCPRIMGLEKGNGPCTHTRLKICSGACTGKEPPSVYNLKFDKAFSARKIKPWPFSGPVLFEEKSRSGKKGEAFVIDNWCLIDSYGFDESTRKRLLHVDYAFDYDTYKIIADYLYNESKRPVSFREIEMADLESILNG